MTTMLYILLHMHITLSCVCSDVELQCRHMRFANYTPSLNPPTWFTASVSPRNTNNKLTLFPMLSEDVASRLYRKYTHIHEFKYSGKYT